MMILGRKVTKLCGSKLSSVCGSRTKTMQKKYIELTGGHNS